MAELAFLAGIVMGGILYRLVIEPKRRKHHREQMTLLESRLAANKELESRIHETQRQADTHLANAQQLHLKLGAKIDEYVEVTRTAKFLSDYWPDKAVYVIYNAKDRTCRGFDRENTEFPVPVEG